jgi:hypothetical protein
VKRILFIGLAVILALSVGLIGCAGEQEEEEEGPETIKVGLVRDTDGILAFYDQIAGGPCYRAFNKTVNAAGGLDMSDYGRKIPIELVIREYNPLTPGELGTQTYALIDVDGVHFVWGGPGTGTIYEQAPICDAKGILLSTLEGGATDMMQDPSMLASWANTFINLSFSDWYQVPVVYEILKDVPIAAPKAYVLYIDNEHGHEYRDVTKAIFGAGNVTAVGHNAFSALYPDIKNIVQTAKNALNSSHPSYDPYDIFCAWTYDPFLGMVMQAFIDLDFDPPHIVMGPGAQSGAYLFSWGDNMEGIMGFATGTKDMTITEPVTMSLTDMWNLVLPEAHGFPSAYAWDPWGHPVIWSGLEMWKEAVEAVGNVDAGYTAAVRTELVAFNSTNPCKTVMGNCWYEVFGAGTGGGVIDYEAMPTQICQWQGGYVKAIGPTVAPYAKYTTTGTYNAAMQGNWNWLLP